MFCPQCGTSNVPNAHFCTSCGRALTQSASPIQSPRSIHDEAVARVEAKMGQDQAKAVRDGRVALGYCFLAVVVIWAGWAIGSLMPQVVFWILLALVAGAGWLFRKKIRLKPILRGATPRDRRNLALITICVLAVIICWTGSVNHDTVAAQNESVAASNARAAVLQAAQDAAAAAQQREHQREAMQNHNRRLAWNLAHPAEVARLKAEAQAKAAAKLAGGGHRVRRG